MCVEGQYFEAGQSAATPARLERLGEQWQLVLPGQPPLQWLMADTQVSDRLGQVPRRLAFADGSQFTTADNDGLDQLLGEDHAQVIGWVDRMERHWGWALGAVAAIPLLLWALFSWGLPLLAAPIANALPDELVEAVDESALEWLDGEWLQPSQLPIQRQRDIQHLVERLPGSDGIHIEVRASEMLGPNALALPAGTVVFTDDMVELAENDNELLAILAHEVGHVRERHALRNAVQSAGVVAVMGWVAGDLTLVTDLVLVSAPAMMQQLSYSRRFEREADAHAMEMLTSVGLPPDCLAEVFSRLDDWVQDNSVELPDWISTHPTLRERIDLARTGQSCP